MAAIIVETPPAFEPVSLAEIKLQLGIGPLEDSDHVTSAMEVSRLRSLITAAREYCENVTGRSLAAKGYLQYLDSFPYYTDTIQSQLAYPPSYYSLPRYSTTLWNYSQMIKLFYSPLVSVGHITYIDSKTGRPKALSPGYAPWFPLATYAAGAVIADSNGNIQTCTTPGTTGLIEPAWALSGTTADASAVWTAGGVAPQSDFIVDSSTEPARIFPSVGQYWPACLYVPNAVGIHFTAGYPDATKVPAAAKLAIKQLVAHWYQDPSAVNNGNMRDVPKSVDMLLGSLTVVDFAPTRG